MSFSKNELVDMIEQLPAMMLMNNDATKMELNKIKKIAVRTDDVLLLDVSFNTWFNMFLDLSAYNGPIFHDYVVAKGLIGAIETAQRDKVTIVTSLNAGDDIFTAREKLPNDSIVHYLKPEISVSQLLTFLNFPKRLTLSCFKSLPNYDKNTIDKFMGNMDRLYDFTYPSYYSKDTRDLRKLLNGIEVGRDKSVFVLPTHQYLENLGKKYNYVKKFCDLGMYINNIDPELSQYFLTSAGNEIPDFNQLIVVNKNYDEGRVICVESIARNFLAYQYAIPLSNYLNRVKYNAKISWRGGTEYVPIGESNWYYQRTNQVLALHASQFNDYVTVDITSASDSNTRKGLELLWPKWHDKILDNNLSALYTMVQGVKWDFPVMFTMGNPNTYPTESAIFSKMVDLAYMRAGCEHELKGVVGDDIVCASKAYPYLAELLTEFGYLINESKTFTTGFYRESCGIECYNGYDVSPLYFPRNPSDNVYSMLVGLQHKFLDYPKTNAFLIDKIRSIRKCTTFSFPGSPYNDIWLKFKREESQYQPKREREFIQRNPVLSTESEYIPYDSVDFNYKYLNKAILNGFRIHAVVPCCPIKFRLRGDTCTHSVEKIDFSQFWGLSIMNDSLRTLSISITKHGVGLFIFSKAQQRYLDIIEDRTGSRDYVRYLNAEVGIFIDGDWHVIEFELPLDLLDYSIKKTTGNNNLVSRNTNVRPQFNTDRRYEQHKCWVERLAYVLSLSKTYKSHYDPKYMELYEIPVPAQRETLYSDASLVLREYDTLI